tara:strand:- start:367 stop:753 length:387 start_codon:yes stop_codon:yes gene_type:complete
MINVLLVGLGSALGGMARFGVALACTARYGTGFPYGTLLANVTGSFLIGVIFSLTGTDGKWPLQDGGKFFFMTGLMGGYTTFSAFSLEAVNLLKDGQNAAAAFYVGLSLVFCLVGAWLGLTLGQTMSR